MSFVSYNKKEEDNDESNKDHFYERSLYDEKNADKEYIQIIMTYGYIIQFGTASPICFLFSNYSSLYCQNYRFFKNDKYAHVNLIDGSSGLGSHIKIISFLNLIGIGYKYYY